MKIIRTKAIALFCICVTIFTISGCGLVKVCIEKPSDIANAYKYTDQYPLTAEGLKQLLIDDTVHYKVVVIYSHCCSPCRERMEDTYSNLWNADTASVRWYFVLEDCSSLKYDNTKFLRHYGISTPYMYYLRDDDPRFRVETEDRFLNIAKYVFENELDLEDVIDGAPCVFVINPQGKLKTEYRRYADGMVVVGNTDDLSPLIYKSVYPKLIPLNNPLRVQDIDFDHRDTTDWSYWGSYTRKPKYCTPEGCF